MRLTLASSDEDGDAAPEPQWGDGAPNLALKLRELLHATPAAARLTLPQFVELLGHIAIGAMPHPVMLDRVRALFRWLDQSEGTRQLATRDRTTPIIRFGVA